MINVEQYTREAITEIERRINTGDLSGASRSLSVLIFAWNNQPPAHVYHLLGIVRRMRADRGDGGGFYRGALEAFDLALNATEDMMLRGQIYRDMSMVSLRQGELAAGRAYLQLSEDHLRPTRKLRMRWVHRQFCAMFAPLSKICADRLAEDNAWTARDQVHIEYFVTQGFKARLLFLESGGEKFWKRFNPLSEMLTNLRKRRQARIVFRRSNRELWNYNPYELNNRVWHFKVEWWWLRLIWAPRTLRLARESGNRNRQYQVLLLIASPLLASYIEESRKGR